MVMADGKVIHKNDYINRAWSLWDTFDDNEKFGVKFGMFPHNKMLEVEKEGYDGHKLVVALMSVSAQANGGKDANAN